MLIKCQGGVDAALAYAKMWCKYVKELLSWIEKRLNYGEWGCTARMLFIFIYTLHGFFINHSQGRSVASKGRAMRNLFCFAKAKRGNYFLPKMIPTSNALALTFQLASNPLCPLTETEFAKGVVKIAESGRNAIIHQVESLGFPCKEAVLLL